MHDIRRDNRGQAQGCPNPPMVRATPVRRHVSMRKETAVTVTDAHALMDDRPSPEPTCETVLAMFERCALCAPTSGGRQVIGQLEQRVITRSSTTIRADPRTQPRRFFMQFKALKGSMVRAGAPIDAGSMLHHVTHPIVSCRAAWIYLVLRFTTGTLTVNAKFLYFWLLAPNASLKAQETAEIHAPCKHRA